LGELAGRGASAAVTLPLKSPIRHFYEVPKAGAPVNLYVGPLDMTAGQTHFSMNGVLQLTWSPTPRMAWYGGSTDPVTSTVAFKLMDSDLTAALPPAVLVPPTLPQQIPTEDDFASESFRSSGVEPALQVGQGQRFSCVTFFVVNHPVVLTASYLGDGEMFWRGRLVLVGGDWTITLDAPRSREDVERWLKRIGGYAVTNTGKLERSDGSMFDAAEALDVLQSLHYVLSLAVGRHVAPVLPVGYQDAQMAVWTDWRAPIIDPWRGNYRMADTHHEEHWQELFAVVQGLWVDPFRREVLQRAIPLLPGCE
jgi:hypothetical protein